MMNLLIIALRLIHIFSGVFWTGTSFFLTASVKPAVKASGPEAGKFMGALAGPGRMTTYLGLTATATAISGLLLYWIVSANLNVGFITSGRGIVLTAGALSGLAAWLHGVFVTSKLARQSAALGKEIQSTEGPPPPEKLKQMKELQEKQFTNGGITAILQAVALIGMSITQYILF
jgi:uncharacterized membrane protein